MAQTPTLSQNLSTKQQQNLVMTPQMQQAIKLLQMSNMDLAAFLEEEIAQNPLLEKGPNEDSGEDETQETNEPRDEQPDAMETAFDTGSEMATVGAGGNSKFEDNEYDPLATIEKPKDLRTHLYDQIAVEITDDKEYRLALLLLDSLDEAGYMREDLAVLSTRLGVDVEKLEIVLKKLQQLDPAGIFARNLEECLAAQLFERGQLTEEAEILLQNLDKVAAHDLKGLAKICEVGVEDIQQILTHIRALNPKPASTFEHFVVQTALPDVLMRKKPKNEGGGWRVELNHATLPRVLINQQYYADVVTGTKDKAAKQFMDTHLNNASWLVKALDSRAQTILKVAAEIIEEQEPFFLYGVEFLKPMTLKEIAEKIQMHESTVSRVTTAKFIGTPRGIFELKYFFTSGVGGDDGGAVHSSEAVKARIKTLIDAETLDNILSDDDLVTLLQKENIEIARRTVAKYREAAGIASSVQRRRMKKLQS
ncbi:MAG: RNA polymerase factor sigma-54 [Alphaproteobacteria bacterium]|nr:RNA polymerase factor sigma-54 [Alphaproteobacteria bacterium]